MTWWTTPTASVQEKCKVVVIGSGPGGTFTALTLAEAGIDVILLERGYHYAYATMPNSLADAVSTLYAEGGFRTADGSPPTPIAGGQGLGGGTLVNSAICFHTPKATLAHWNELTDGRFADEDDYYRRQDDIDRVMKVRETIEPLLSGTDKAHKRAAIKLGWLEGNIARNTPSCGGCGRCNAGCPIGGKNSLDRELLPRAAKAGARIYSGCLVEGILPNGVLGRVINRFGQEVGVLDIEADIVVLAAGTIATPQLLLESGIAPNNDQIGKGLHIHPVINTWAMLPEPVYARGATQGHFIDEFADDNVLLESNPTLGGGLFLAFPFHGAKAKEVMAKGAHGVSTGALIRDTSEGEVHRRRNGTSKITYNVNEIDRKRLLKGLRKGAELWLDGAEATFVAPGIFGTQICKTMDEVHRLLPDDFPADRLVNYCSHPQASCRMGRACDTDGLLRGTSNVYVIDASVLPSNVGRNPQISIMTVSRMLAEGLAERLGGTIKPL